MSHHTHSAVPAASDSVQTAPKVWALCDNRAGNVSQVMGVAEALGVPFAVKTLTYGRLARLPNPLLGASFGGLDDNSRADLCEPWPDLVIAAGRRTAPVARRIKALGGDAVRLVQIMHPGPGGSRGFDLICVPRHDRVAEAANVMRITGAPHRVTPSRLAEASAHWAGQFSKLAGPRIALIVGGGTKNRSFGVDLAADLAHQVNGLAGRLNGSVLATTSRRTSSDAADVLARELSGPHQLYRWGDEGENPYFGYLALADCVVVTGDSVSMICEACATGKPVYVYAPPGFTARKHQDFLRSAVDGGHVRVLSETTETWTPVPLNAAGEIVNEIRRRQLLGEQP